ncbi:3-oxoacyl-ACP synthase [Streptomyces filipinensis]|uniref:3-oxoacyl-ACP synthase n=1 Tax=Streptomyces filipinensis TaxID=66887 RepID=A0A918IEV8_9ACTN|nr:3-oxoacyl-[acyl-carrier-protein] synthase III C-terminal domain-containing protein [Streptomyces filipinensis]GGV09090.1 3-oxoacyl-ACP synthase [Streptomyces filipinensis]
MSGFSRISSVAVHLPQQRQTAAEMEETMRATQPHLLILDGLLERLYGLQERRVAPPGSMPSDLAAAAAEVALQRAGLSPSDVDLLVFASVSEDLEEPATAHVVAHKLGATAPVVDVKNACNGVLNAMQLADALIRTGAHTTVLIVSGEMPSRLMGLEVAGRSDLVFALPAYTGGDLGAALIMQASEQPGLLGMRFVANSAAWSTATMINPYFGADDRPRCPRIDSEALVRSFTGMALDGLRAMHELGYKIGDADLVCVHQPSVPLTVATCAGMGVTPEQVIPVFARHGNVGTGCLPLQLTEALEAGRLRRGDLVALFGLASGTSGGFALCQW